MGFIYEFYPEYGSEADYGTFFKWLHNRSKSEEDAHKMSRAAYDRPTRSKMVANEYSDEDNSDDDAN
jgi:hypothetical protein